MFTKHVLSTSAFWITQKPQIGLEMKIILLLYKEL